MRHHTNTIGPHYRPKLYVKALALLMLSVLSNAVLAAAPSSPTDLRIAVYSDTAAELFWARATDDGVVVGYEVQLNDDVVTTRDATSYYTDSLKPGQRYNVSVTSIDNEGDRSAPVTISFISGNRSTPDTPTTEVATPTGLTASIYSTKSLELFWDRPQTFGLQYEIKRDGNVLSITDGVSFYENQLLRNTVYVYQVTAINQQGERSTPAEVIAKTNNGGSGIDDPEEPPTPPVGDVAVPTGLTSSVYSGTTAELFWDRPKTVGLIYEVTRNGNLIDTTEGVSFYDSQLSPGTQYTYKVVAINLQNARSAAATVVLNTPGNDDNDNPDGPDNPVSPPIVDPVDLYTRDGYAPINVIRVDLRTAIEPGPCNADDESGCTLADVLADTDKFDDHTVDIKVHFKSDDFADDGTVSNAELRLRGGGSRFAPQKSFRIKLDSKKVLWRGERHLQLNKHPFDLRRVRNKVAMDVMSKIPNLPSFRTQFVNLWIDDGEGPVDYGLFTHVERVNEYFLRNRGWNDDGRVYKAEYFRFAKTDLPNLQLDEEGEPLDEDLFERTLEIENGDDHRTLVAMMSALHNPDRSFKSVLEQYFDRKNVVAWVAANILLRQNDAVRHNFILYNPVGSEKFYFIPWDYDAAVAPWKEPPNDLSNDSLRQRHEYGYATAARNPFLENFYRQPGIHEEILAAVANLRQNYVTDQLMVERTDLFAELVAPFQYREPDSVHNPEFSEYAVKRMADVPRRNQEALQTRFNVLMPPMLAEPALESNQWVFSWVPAFDVTSKAGSVSYRLQVARTPTFDIDSIFVDIDAIDDVKGTVKQAVNVDQLPSGEYFVRLIATPANEPERNWQVSGNKLYYKNKVYYGALRFNVP